MCGGYNTNPTAVSIQNAYKKSLLHDEFHDKFTGNCVPLESIPILNCTYTKHPVDRVSRGQVNEIAKKYYDLIKQKDRGGLFYPSDSLYRIATFADLVFTAALKDSGKKMLKRKFTLNRLVASAQNICCKYSNVLFLDLKNHFEVEPEHEDSLIESILKFYLKIRIDFLNKTFFIYELV